MLRAAMTTGWWALMMTAFSSDLDSTLLKWYNNVLKVLGCLTLFMTANLLKVLFAKIMASKFNQASHYTKMQDALKRVGGSSVGLGGCCVFVRALGGAMGPPPRRADGGIKGLSCFECDACLAWPLSQLTLMGDGLPFFAWPACRSTCCTCCCSRGSGTPRWKSWRRKQRRMRWAARGARART